MGLFEFLPWYEAVLNVAIVGISTVYLASAVSHCVAMWILRKDFFVAVRYVRGSVRKAVRKATKLQQYFPCTS